MDTGIIVALIGGLATILAGAATAIATYRGRPARLRIRKASGIDVIQAVDPRDDLRASIQKDDLRHLTSFLQAVETKLKERKYDRECVDAVLVTVAELARNGFTYGCSSGAQTLELRVITSATLATVWVANAKGVYFPATDNGIPVLPVHPNPEDLSGRGLFFCREHADWLHLINAPDRGMVEAGFFRERVTFSERMATDTITVLGISSNSANPSVTRRAVQEVDRLLSLGQSVVILCVGTTSDSERIAEEERDARFNFQSDFSIQIIDRYSNLKSNRVVLVGPAAFRSLFPRLTYATSVEEAIEIARSVPIGTPHGPPLGKDEPYSRQLSLDEWSAISKPGTLSRHPRSDDDIST